MKGCATQRKPLRTRAPVFPSGSALRQSRLAAWRGHRVAQRSMPAPPRHESELLARAHALFGCSVEELAARLEMRVGATGVHTKGKVGELVERALGATGDPGRRGISPSSASS